MGTDGGDQEERGNSGPETGRWMKAGDSDPWRSVASRRLLKLWGAQLLVFSEQGAGMPNTLQLMGRSLQRVHPSQPRVTEREYVTLGKAGELEQGKGRGTHDGDRAAREVGTEASLTVGYVRS